MKKVFKLTMIGMIAFFVGMFFSMTSFAQEVLPVVSESDVLKSVFSLVTSYKEMSAFALALAVVQLLTKVLSLQSLGSIFPNLTGKMKLVMITFLSLVAGVISLKVSGLSWLECIMHSGTLAAVQVFGHQFYKEFIQKKE
jgi:hypothetical protein